MASASSSSSSSSSAEHHHHRHLLLPPSKKRPCPFDPPSPKRLSSSFPSSFLDDLSEFDSSPDFPPSFSSSHEKLLSDMMKNLEEVLQSSASAPPVQPSLELPSVSRSSPSDASPSAACVGAESVLSVDVHLLDFLTDDLSTATSSASSVCEASFDSGNDLPLSSDQLAVYEWPIFLDSLDSSAVFDDDFEQVPEEASLVAEMAPLF